MTDLIALATEIRKQLDASKVAARVTVKDKLDAISDKDLATVVPLFDEWKPDGVYNVGDVRSDNKILYRCVQGHTAQADWSPHSVPAMWAPVRKTTGGTPDPWVQPKGAQDAYKIGDRVTHGGTIWVSTAASNVWEPGVFGWTQE